MTTLHQLASLGQSIWYATLRRALLDSGDLQALLDAGVSGVTSNLFRLEKVIGGSADYDEALEELVQRGASGLDIYESLVLEDSRRAADLLRPVYARTQGVDGYVSLEVNPTVAHDTDATVDEARRLSAALGRPNVMIKVPATPAGILAMESLIGAGVNVNVTLAFSLDHYDAVAGAYLAGLERLAAAGGDLSQVASVVSVPVREVDSAVGRALEAAGNVDLQGKIAIANVKAIYARFRQVFGSERWQQLAQQGARVQRPLWAGTSVQNPLYPDTLYADALIGPDSVSTMAPSTLHAFLDHGTVALTLERGIDQARAQLQRLDNLGIDLDAITATLQEEGIAAFAQSFEALQGRIAEKRDQVRTRWQRRSAHLGGYERAVDAALEEAGRDRVIARIWTHDFTVWQPEPTEITNRLGWLHIAEVMQAQVPRLTALTEAVRAAGYTDVLLMGMGGSSLAPEVFGRVFAGQVAGLPVLSVLDSTDPGAVRTLTERLDPARTLFMVSSKSGGTAETLSFFKYFYTWTSEVLGPNRAGEHFIAITDPGSKLVDLAQRYGFRDTFQNDPNIGGRYSALSYVGLVPAALVGVDVDSLLQRALTMASNCEPSNRPLKGDNDGAWLGTILGKLAQAGRDKITFVTSPALANFGDWVEQLIAESTGKDGTGILPVVGEPVSPPSVYGPDRLFVYLRLDGDGAHDPALRALEGVGHPVVRLHLRDLYDLGGQFFLWELATAVAGYRLGIHPFDQPNVEAAKVLARQAIDRYGETGELPDDEPAPLTAAALEAFVAQAQPHDYLALQAFVQPTDQTTSALHALRIRLRDRLHLATTLGYGPRFLHSTGQLHKGDAGHGLFVQFTSDAERDLPIPDEPGSPDSSITFGLLKRAQALGDKQALENAGRRVIRFHLGTDVIGGLEALRDAL